MSGILHCPGCGVEITTADMDLAVPTDEGVWHGTCFEGDVPAVTVIEWKDGSDIPEEVAGAQLARYEALFGAFPCVPFTVAQQRGQSLHDQAATNTVNRPLTQEELVAMFEATDNARLAREDTGPAVEHDTYDKSERLADEMQDIERQMGGRYDEDGYGF